MSVLVEPTVPLAVVAADRNDARNQLLGSVVVTVLVAAVGVWAFDGY